MSVEEFKFQNLLEKGEIVQINNLTWTDNLKELKINKCCNIDNLVIPNSVKKIHFGPNFNLSLDKIILSNKLEEIRFGVIFNKSLTKILFPESLKIIEFEGKYMQSIENITFPKHLETLILGPQFNLPIDNIQLPKSLKTLRFGNNYNQPIERVVFPNNLENLSLGKSFNNNLNNLPISLISLELNGLNFPLTNLPYTLKYLTIFIKKDDYEKINKNIDLSKIPYACKIHKVIVNEYSWW